MLAIDASLLPHVLQRMGRVRQGRDYFMGLCPGHRDHQPSLQVRLRGSRLLIRCFAGCTDNTLRRALELPESAPVAEPKTRVFSWAEIVGQYLPFGELTRTWFYHDSQGNVVACVLRFDGPQGKTYRTIVPDSGGWRAAFPPAPIPLYGLPAILQQPDARVYICEGEKAADAGNRLGLLCTTSIGGASQAHKTDWSCLAGRDVVILPDNDPPGHRYAQAIARILLRLRPPARVRLVDLPGLPPGGDLADFIEACPLTPADELRAQIEILANAARLERGGAEPPAPQLSRLHRVSLSKVQWLAPPVIPLGKLTLLVGQAGVGKSILSADLAAAVTLGQRWPLRDAPSGMSGGVLMVAGEDDIADTIAPRLHAAGAALNQVAYCDQTSRGPLELPRDIDSLDEALARLESPRLLIIDPITAYLGELDTHMNSLVRRALSPLQELARRRRIAVLLITHPRKGEGSWLERAVGSIAFVAASRSVWAFIPDRRTHNPTERLLVPIKTNLAAPPAAFACSIVVRDDLPTIVWAAERPEIDLDAST